MESDTQVPPPVILLTHKDPVIRLGLTLALQHANFDGQIHGVAADREDFPAALRTASVVVTDYAHGVDLCLETKKAPFVESLSRPKVLVISHRHSEHEIRSALSAGVMGYLQFGAELKEIIEAIESLLNNSRYLTGTAMQTIVDGMMHEDLTPRELDVLFCLVKGRVNKQISEELDIALGTVKSHVKSIFNKFGVVTRTQAVTVALQRGLSSIGTDSMQGTSR